MPKERQEIGGQSGRIGWEMCVRLPFLYDTTFTDKKSRPDKKYIDFSCTKGQHVYLEMIELEMIEHGHDHIEVDPMERDRDLRSTFGPPLNISVVSNSVMGCCDAAVDDMTVQFSFFEERKEPVFSREVYKVVPWIGRQRVPLLSGCTKQSPDNR